MTDDEAARSELAKQRRDGRQPEIDAHPGRIGVQLEEDQRSEHCRQHAADRTAGLLQKHRHHGDHHAGQRTLFLRLQPFQPKEARRQRCRLPAANGGELTPGLDRPVPRPGEGRHQLSDRRPKHRDRHGWLG
jgi:hypothetical protein